jgi:potassium efflux system protein
MGRIVTTCIGTLRAMRLLDTKRRRAFLLVGAILALCLGPLSPAQAAPAQETPAPPPVPAPVPAPVPDEPGADALDTESLQEVKQALDTNTSLGEDARSAALAEIQAAQDALTRTAASAAITEQYRVDVQAAPDRIASIKEDLAQPLELSAPVRTPGSTLAELQDQRDAATSSLAEAQGARDRFQASATGRSERLVAIDGELLSAQGKLDALLGALEAPATTEQDPTILDAQRYRLLAEIQEARALLSRLDAEQDRNQAEEQLIFLRLDLARRSVGAAETQQEAWDQILRDGRSEDAAQAVEKASQSRTDLALKHADLGPVIKSVEELSAELSGPESVVALMNAASEERTSIEKEFIRVRASYQDTLERFRVAGATEALGFFLRLEYDKLQDPGRLRIESRRRQRQSSKAYYRVHVLRERRLDLGDVGGRVQRLVEQAQGISSEETRQAFVLAATELCTNERELVDSLTRNNEAYGHILAATEASVASLIAITEAYENFIRQHIVWQRSVDLPFNYDPPVVLDGLEWIAKGDDGDIENLGLELSSHGYLLTFYGLLIAVLFLARHKARTRISALGPLVRSYRTDSLTHTRWALVLTLVAALPLPAVVYGAGWLLEQTGTESAWRSSWGHALGALTGYLFAISITLEVVRKDGLGKAHLRWAEESCRKMVVLAIEFLVPIWLLGLAQRPLQIYGESPYRDTTGRLLFIVTMSILSVFCYRTFAPRGKVLRTFYSQHPDSILARTRGSLHVLAVAGPVLTVLLAVFGYYFTARMIGRGILGTHILAFSVLVMASLATRWQVFHRRRLAHELALEKRAERDAGTSPTEIDASEIDDDVDIPDLDARTTRLIGNAAAAIVVVGLMSIWSDALPALRVLERVQILPSLEVTDETVMDTDWLVPGLTTIASTAPPTRPPTSDEQAATSKPASDETAAAPSVPLRLPGTSLPSDPTSQAVTSASAYTLTVADVLSALIALLVTIIVVRNGPALLELGLLTRLNMDAGARYAITTLLQYTLIIIGGTLTFNALGVGWSSVQWLAAALTFGLAFGLQEIFANFISGLILLVERPIRIGDTVTIGDLTGMVARIRPRATTILDYDNRERLIPNKSLITDEVINWTLSSSVTRLVIPVGVAYGTNTKAVFENLMRAATSSPPVMDDPAPSVLFKGFGESSLDFSLRFYIADRDHWVDAMNAVNTRIDELFRAAGIEIAFPQRDLHLRSSDVSLGPR